MRGWSGGEQIRRDLESRGDREQARQDRTEDREYTRGRRAREVTLDQRADTTWNQQQAEHEANAPLREAQRSAGIALAEDTAPRIEYERGRRDHEVAGRMTPEQQRRANELSLESGEGQIRQQAATLENTKATTANTRETTRGSRLRNDITAEVIDLDRQIAALDSGQFKSLQNPEYRQTAMDLYEDLIQGKGLRAPDKLYGFMNDTFADELGVGVGDKVGGTDDVISQKRISALYEDPRNPGNVMIELDVRAKRKDGSEYDYKAPVTKGRRSDETDEIQSIPKAKLMERLQGVVGASLDVEAGFDVQDLRSKLVARRDALAGSAGRGGRGGAGKGETAYERNARFVAQHKFGGDVEKALDWIKGKDSRTQIVELTKMLSDFQKDESKSRQLTPAQLLQRAVEMQASLAGGDRGRGSDADTELDPSAAGESGPAARAGDSRAPSGMAVIGRTPDGRTVYEDAEGNQFTEE